MGLGLRFYHLEVFGLIKTEQYRLREIVVPLYNITFNSRFRHKIQFKPDLRMERKRESIKQVYKPL